MLIKRDQSRSAMLDPLDCDRPTIWIGPHVGRRISEGMQTLRLLPMGNAGGSNTAWPPYTYEFDDLVAQKEQGELEKTQRMQNRTRVSPSVREITQAVMSCYWPMQYLFLTYPHLCEAVNAVAMAHSLGRDADWVTRKRGGYGDTWRSRHDKGCDLIADYLNRDRVLVF